MAAAPSSLSLGTVLVIGGCGFLGHNIVNQLLNFPLEASVRDAGNNASNAGVKSSTNGYSQPGSDSSNASVYQVPPPSSYPPLKGRYPSITNTSVNVLDVKTDRNVFPGAKYYSGDITSAPSVLEVFKKVKPDVVIHTASPPAVDGKHEMWRKVNVDGTRTLLDVAAGNAGDWGGKCLAFVFTSSSSVVHDSVSSMIARDESWPYVQGADQIEYYSDTKAQAEQFVLAANRSPSHMLTCALRPALIFGEGDGQLTVKLVESYRKKQTNIQIGENENLYDFTYVGNVAYAHLLAADALLETSKLNVTPLSHERVDGEAFNITNDEPVYFWDVPRLAWTIAGGAADPTQGQVWTLGYHTMMAIGLVVESLFWCMGRTPYLTRRIVKYTCLTRYLTCEKAKRRLGYRPAVHLDEAVGRAVGRFFEIEREEAAKKGQ